MPVGTEVKEGTGIIIAVGVFSLGPMVGVPKSNPGVGVGVDGGAIVEVAGDSMVAEGVALAGFSVGPVIGSVAGGFVDERFGVIVVLPPPGVEVGIGGTMVGVIVGKGVGAVVPMPGVDVGKGGTMDGGSSVGVGVRSGGVVTFAMRRSLVAVRKFLHWFLFA